MESTQEANKRVERGQRGEGWWRTASSDENSSALPTWVPVTVLLSVLLVLQIVLHTGQHLIHALSQCLATLQINTAFLIININLLNEYEPTIAMTYTYNDVQPSPSFYFHHLSQLFSLCCASHQDIFYAFFVFLDEHHTQSSLFFVLPSSHLCPQTCWSGSEPKLEPVPSFISRVMHIIIFLPSASSSLLHLEIIKHCIFNKILLIWYFVYLKAI